KVVPLTSDQIPRIRRPRKPRMIAPIRHRNIGSEAEARRMAISICERLGDRLITPDGEIIPFEHLKSVELVEVMKGNISEVIKMYTEPELVQDIAAMQRPRRDHMDVTAQVHDDPVITSLIATGGVVIDVSDTPTVHPDHELSRFEQLQIE